MSWVRASSRHEEAVLRLILRDEARCVSASSRLRAETGKCMLYVNESAEAAGELILYTEYGLLLPILPEGGTDGEALKRILLELRPPLHSIMGVSRWVRRIEALMPLQPSTGIQYNLMTVTERDVAPVAGRPFTPVIRRASPMDAEALFPLQRDYEREEVVVNPRIFNELQCMRLLKKSLGNELVFFAEKDGAPVAKAGTNARGFGVDQIGGVFTAPAERGRGYAEAVMRVLLTFIFEEKHTASLFVKKKNAAANALYLKLGFTQIDDFLIDYYGM